MSLLYTMQALDRECYEPMVALIWPHRALIDFYQNHGFKVVPAPGVRIFAHTTGGYARFNSWSSITNIVRSLYHWNTSKEKTIELINKVKPDIVHLNSAVLLPSVLALIKANFPFVWHIREYPPNQGLRTRLFRKFMLRTPHIIFLSEFDRQAWTNNNFGTVVYNFVDFKKFDRSIDKAEARRELGLPGKAPLVLYAGGTVRIKGFWVLIEAIPHVLAMFPDAQFIMPSSKICPSQRLAARIGRKILPLVGSGSPSQKLFNTIDRLGIRHAVKMLPFAKDIVKYMAACDLLVFPATTPHFARPVIEASAMAKPVVGSDIGGMKELIEDGKTGILVPPCDPPALADAICQILGNSSLSREMGEQGFQFATQRFSATANIKKIVKIYESILSQS